MTGISVIMPSYLGEYTGSRKDPEKKFVRAVQSFLENTLLNKELIIVSDGCQSTIDIYESKFKKYDEISLIQVEKRKEPWPGELRECGRSLAKYDWITYLDTDDIYLNSHLYLIEQAVLSKKEETTVFINSAYILPLPLNPTKRMLAYVGMDIIEYNKLRNKSNELYQNKVIMSNAMGANGTWQIVHHKHVPHRWKNTDKMGEDKLFIENLKSTESLERFKGGYFICHNTIDRETIWEV